MVPPDFFKFFWILWLLSFAAVEFYAVRSGIGGWPAAWY